MDLDTQARPLFHDANNTPRPFSFRCLPYDESRVACTAIVSMTSITQISQLLFYFLNVTCYNTPAFPDHEIPISF
jgi:hypothetical protein